MKATAQTHAVIRHKTERELFSFDRILFKSNIFTVVKGHILHILMHRGEQCSTENHYIFHEGIL